MPKGWRTIHIPEEMAQAIENFIVRSDVKEKYAFGSIPEFIRRAISSYMVQVQKEITIFTYGETTEARIDKLMKEEPQKSD
ncbi:MAG: hypothetical protein HZR80_18750 [Candidatus Heimdallarchaeota archaeon]